MQHFILCQQQQNVALLLVHDAINVCMTANQIDGVNVNEGEHFRLRFNIFIVSNIFGRGHNVGIICA